MPNAANRIFGSIDRNFGRSAGPVNTTREGIYSQQAIYMPYTSSMASILLLRYLSGCSGPIQVIGRLQIHPEFWRSPQGVSEI